MEKIRCCTRCKENGIYKLLPVGRTSSFCKECFTPYQQSRRAAELEANPEEVRRKAREEKRKSREVWRQRATKGMVRINGRWCWPAPRQSAASSVVTLEQSI